MSQKINWWCKSRRAQSKDDFETWLEGGVTPTLNAFDNGDTRTTTLVAYPIQDGREIEKSQNGLGIGDEGSPAYTVDTHATQAVAIQGNMIGRADTAGPQGKGYTEEGEPMFTLTKTDIHAVANSSIVRRLLPTECEALQGFPRDWTKFDSDGKEQADSHRYKQMGNAVCVDVAEFVVSRLVSLHEKANVVDGN